MKKLLFFSIAALMAIAVSCKKPAAKPEVLTVEKQWTADMKQTDGTVIHRYWDIGVTFPKWAIYWDSSFSDDENAQPQFKGEYSIEELPNGCIKVFREGEDHFYVFSDLTATTAQNTLYYNYDPEDGSERDELGWASEHREFKVADPLRKLFWKQLTLTAGGKNYALTEGYFSDGFDSIRVLKEDLLKGDSGSLPCVRMDNSGTEADFSIVDVDGKVAIVNRGEISFWQKLQFASQKGAIALICVDNQPGTTHVSLEQLPSSVKKIPYFSVSQEAGAHLSGATTVTVKTIENPGLLSE